MDINLQKLEVRNFQKFKQSMFEFGQVTQISGENGAGKTTIYSALTWLLFGKDSRGRDTGKGGFEIKPIIDNEVIHHIDVTVIGFFSIGGKEVKIQRLLTENWTKGKDSHYMGDETKGFVDDVPYKITDFERYISDNLLSEQEFRMITDVNYFLSQQTDFKRKYLCQMGGVRNANEIIKDKIEWQKFLDEASGKSLEDILKQISYEQKELKKEYDEIDPGIKALEESKPEPLDWEFLSAKKLEIEEKIKAVNESLTDRNKQGEQKDKELNILRSQSSNIRTDLFNNLNKIQDLKNKLEGEKKKELREKDSKRSELIDKVKSLERSAFAILNNLSDDKKLLEGFEAKKNDLFNDYKAKKEEVFESDNRDTICPLLKEHICNSPELLEYIKQNREKAESDFNQNKIGKLKIIIESGKNAVAKVDEIKANIEKEEEELKSINAEIKSTKTVIESMPVYSEKTVEITSPELNELKEESIRLNTKKNNIEKLIDDFNLNNKVDNSDLMLQRNTLDNERDEIIRKLSIKEQIENIDKQIESYNLRGKKLAERITELDNKEFTAKEINRVVVEDATARVNGLFTLINWQLFELQKNGLYAECCKPAIKGVSASLNTGSIVNAGIDIVNAISKFKGITAPLFIDNAESVNELLPTLGQSIYLRVMPKGASLNINIIK